MDGILESMDISVILGIVAILAGLTQVIIQARGRGESVVLWSFIYLTVLAPAVMIPFPAITAVIVAASMLAVPLLMKPWKRKSLTIVAPSYIAKAQILEMAKNSGHVDKETDIRIHYSDEVPEDAVALKVYQHVAQQTELNKDASALRQHGIVPYIRFGPITTLSVRAGDLEMASLLFGIEMEKTYNPSEN